MFKHKFTFVLFLALLTACNLELNEGSSRLGTITETFEEEITNSVFYYSDELLEDNFVIQKDDHFQITLISAFICDFKEIGGFSDAIALSNNGSARCIENERKFSDQGVATQGEIAILGGFHLRNSGVDQNDIPNQRLIYFNDDVRETGQLLNFINLPLYGPATYIPSSSRLRLTILEIDQDEAKEQAAFLEAVATAGASVASPVQGSALGLLSNIGSALIQSNKDDRELSFDIGFDAPNTNSNVPRLLLREGYLAVIRKERRSDQDHFKSLKICPSEGLIVNVSDDEGANNACDSGNFYNGDTWLLLRISKEDESVTNAVLTKTFEELINARTGGASSFSSLAKLGTELEAYLCDIGKKPKNQCKQ